MNATPEGLRSTCVVCGASLLSRWTADGLDTLGWVDEFDSHKGGSSPYPDAGAYLSALLAARDYEGYAVAKVRFQMGSGLLPGEHWHAPAPREPYEGTVPECHGAPMRRVRDGWACRRNEFCGLLLAG